MEIFIKKKLDSVLFTIAIGVVLYILYCRTLLIFSYHTDLGGFEQIFIYFTQRVMGHLPLYTNPEEVPFSIVQYTPIYFYIITAIAKLLSLNPAKDVIELYWIGRSVSLCANLLSVYAIYKTTNLFLPTNLRRFPLIFIIYFCSLTPQHLAARPDALEVCFMSFFMYFLLRYNASNKTINILLCILFAWLAILSKQQAVPEVILVFLVYMFFYYRDYKKVFLSGISVSVLICGIFLLCFRGEYLPVLFSKLGDQRSIAYLLLISKCYLFYLLYLLFLFAYVTICFIRVPSKPTSIKFFYTCSVIVLVYDIATLSIWGSTFVYTFFSLTLLVMMVSVFQLSGKQWVYYTLIISSCILLAGNYKGLVRYPMEARQHELYKEDYFYKSELANYISHQVNPQTDYILTFDKLLINFLYPNALFPTYDHEFIQYAKEVTYIPILPHRRYTYSNLAKLQAKNQPKLIIIEKTSPFNSFLSVHYNQYTAIYSDSVFTINSINKSH